MVQWENKRDEGPQDKKQKPRLEGGLQAVVADRDAAGRACCSCHLWVGCASPRLLLSV